MDDALRDELDGYLHAAWELLAQVQQYVAEGASTAAKGALKDAEHQVHRALAALRDEGGPGGRLRVIRLPP